jgi:hypothetical protein
MIFHASYLIFIQPIYPTTYCSVVPAKSNFNLSEAKHLFWKNPMLPGRADISTYKSATSALQAE